MRIKERIIEKIPENKRKPLTKTYHIFNVVKNVICWLLLIILTVGIVTFLFVRINGGTPNVFGYSIQRVVTGSMEPTLKVGDIIINKDIEDVSQLKKGDIITFKGGSEFENNRVTHRVYVAPYEREGVYYLRTKGDANSNADNPITEDAVESILVCQTNFMQVFFDFFLSPWGLIVFIFLIIIMFFDEAINIVRYIVFGNDEDKKSEEETLSEIIERVRKEEEEKQLYNEDGYLLKHLENSKEYIAKLKEDEERNKEESEEIQKDTEKCIEEEQTSELDENESEFENDEKTEE